MKQTARCAKDGRANPAERQNHSSGTRARQARPAALPEPRRTLRSWKKSVAGEGEHHFASLIYGQIVCVAPKLPSRHSRHASDGPQMAHGKSPREKSCKVGGKC
jgi:hypothetical protein